MSIFVAIIKQQVVVLSCYHKLLCSFSFLMIKIHFEPTHSSSNLPVQAASQTPPAPSAPRFFAPSEALPLRAYSVRREIPPLSTPGMIEPESSRTTKHERSVTDMAIQLGHTDRQIIIAASHKNFQKFLSMKPFTRNHIFCSKSALKLTYSKGEFL